MPTQDWDTFTQHDVLVNDDGMMDLEAFETAMRFLCPKLQTLDLRGLRAHNIQTLNPKTLNPEHQTPNAKPASEYYATGIKEYYATGIKDRPPQAEP